MRLTEEQAKAVASRAAIVLVEAAPGSGKTRTAIARYTAHFNEGGKCDEVVIITFTNAGAIELAKRIKELCLPKPGFIGTLHAYALMNLQRARIAAGKTPFEVLDEETVTKSIRALAESLKVNAPLSTIMGFLSVESPNLGNKAAIVAMKWRKQCLQSGIVDFDTILALFLIELKAGRLDIESPALLIVDEFQDSAPIDVEIYSELDADFLFIVGDTDQSIFGFRGSRVENMLELKEMEGVEVFGLSINFRCGENVIKMARSLISHNDRNFGSKMKGTGKIDKTEIIRPKTEGEQITALLAWARDLPKDQTAILCRTNASLQRISPVFASMMPTQSALSGSPFVTLALQAAKALVKHSIPLATAGAFLSASKVPMEVIRFMASLSSNSPEQMVADLTAMQHEESYEGDGVFVGTLHSAKGREWDHVAIVDVVQECFPAQKRGSELEAERRLFYVGITRARESLLISAPEMWTPPFCRGMLPAHESQFIMETLKTWGE